MQSALCCNNYTAYIIKGNIYIFTTKDYDKTVLNISNIADKKLTRQEILELKMSSKCSDSIEDTLLNVFNGVQISDLDASNSEIHSYCDDTEDSEYEDADDEIDSDTTISNSKISKKTKITYKYQTSKRSKLLPDYTQLTKYFAEDEYACYLISCSEPATYIIGNETKIAYINAKSECIVCTQTTSHFKLSTLPISEIYCNRYGVFMITQANTLECSTTYPSKLITFLKSLRYGSGDSLNEMNSIYCNDRIFLTFGVLCMHVILPNSIKLPKELHAKSIHKYSNFNLISFINVKDVKCNGTHIVFLTHSNNIYIIELEIGGSAGRDTLTKIPFKNVLDAFPCLHVTSLFGASLELYLTNSRFFVHLPNNKLVVYDLNTYIGIILEKNLTHLISFNDEIVGFDENGVTCSVHDTTPIHWDKILQNGIEFDLNVMGCMLSTLSHYNVVGVLSCRACKLIIMDDGSVGVYGSTIKYNLKGIHIDLHLNE